jgi:hypothetical protein
VKPAHTPGPWRLEHDEPYSAEIVDADGRRVFGLKVWLDDACHDRNHEALANGCLAAAAPELLVALGALGAIGNGYCFCSDNRDPDKTDHQPECREARAALAKAEGRS